MNFIVVNIQKILDEIFIKYRKYFISISTLTSGEELQMNSDLKSFRPYMVCVLVQGY